MMKNVTIYLAALLSAFAVSCENKGFDGEPEDPYSQSEDKDKIVADTVWFNQFTLNKGIRSMAVLNENGDTVEYASFYSNGTPELYLNNQIGASYEFDENGRPTIVVIVDESSAAIYTLEYSNDADLLVPVYDYLGPGLYNFAAIHADDPHHFSILPGLSKVTKRTSDYKTVWIRKYVYVDAGSSQWMKVYTENSYSGGTTEVDRIEYEGKLPTYSDSLSVDTIIFREDRLIDSYRFRYIDDNGALITETCTFRSAGGFLYPRTTVQEGGEYRVEYRYSTRGNLESVVTGDNADQEYRAVYEYDSSGNWTKMQFSVLSFRRSIVYY